METKALLRLIKDDIKLLDEMTGSLISGENLLPEEIEVALARAKSVAAELEMLGRIAAREQEAIIKPESLTGSADEEEIRLSPDETILSDSDQELIDLEELEAALPAAEETIRDKRAELPVPDGKPVINDQTGKAGKHERIANAAVQGALFDEDGRDTSKARGEAGGAKRQMIKELLAKERPGISFEEKPLKSLREGVSINDRYIFTRELFGNVPEKYEETIAALDGFNEIEEAVGYLKQNFKWSKSEAGQRFLTLIKRRYIK